MNSWFSGFSLKIKPFYNTCQPHQTTRQTKSLSRLTSALTWVEYSDLNVSWIDCFAGQPAVTPTLMQKIRWFSSTLFLQMVEYLLNHHSVFDASASRVRACKQAWQNVSLHNLTPILVPLQQHSGWCENKAGKTMLLSKDEPNPDWIDTLSQVQK